MPRYIDAEKLTKVLGEKCDGCKDKWTDYCTTCCDVEQLIEMIDNADDEDVVERKKGNWESIYGYGVSFGCSVCGYLTCCASRFCPNCGAEMEKDDETN